MESRLEETRLELERSRAECGRLAQIRDDVEAEVRELTASLFQVPPLRPVRHWPLSATHASLQSSEPYRLIFFRSLRLVVSRVGGQISGSSFNCWEVQKAGIR